MGFSVQESADVDLAIGPDLFADADSLSTLEFTLIGSSIFPGEQALSVILIIEEFSFILIAAFISFDSFPLLLISDE
jgi:hypothetical protein